MDEVLEQFKNTQVGDSDSKQKNVSKSGFEALYKNWGRLDKQEDRRKEILEIQKSNRNNSIDKSRGILDLVCAVEENYESQVYKSQNRYRPSIYVAGFHKASPTYRNVLMLSEWMIEKPFDFYDNWYVVPCPKGVRTLLVANRGKTKCYSKYGKFKMESRTALPGGNPLDGTYKKNQCCVLDCFYVEKNNTMYVLDLLAWNNQPMTDCDTEFRHYWLTSQFSENPDLKIISNKNMLFFTLLPKVSCAIDSLNSFMSQYPAFECNFPPLDGFLFYHKQTHYVGGETPLVGWLFPFMVQEVLGSEVKVNEKFQIKPEGYTNQADYVTKFEEKYAKKPFNRRSNASNASVTSHGDDETDEMEVTTSESNENKGTGIEFVKATDNDIEE